jgi:hypothetical protein
MDSSAKTEYCAFIEAVEHLGDRWSPLIVPELALFRPQGRVFGDPRLVSQLPGWFLPVARDEDARLDLSPRGPGLAVSGTG